MSITLLEKCKPTTIHNFSFVNNEHFKLIKALKTKDKVPIIVSGSTGIGKTVFVNLVTKFLGFDIINIDFLDLKPLTIKSILQTFHHCFDKKEKILIIDNIDFYTHEKYNKLFEHKIRVVFITTNLYDTFLSRYKKGCIVVNLRMNSPDIYKVIRNIVEKNDINIKNEIIRTLIDKHNCDIRAIINDLEFIKHVSKNNSKMPIERSIYKVTNQLFTENLKHKVRDGYFDFLGFTYETFRDKLLDFCFANYTENAKSKAQMYNVSSALSNCFELPFDYKFIFLDVVNRHCRSIQGFDIKMPFSKDNSMLKTKGGMFIKNSDTTNQFDYLGDERYLVIEYFNVTLQKFKNGSEDILTIKNILTRFPFLENEEVLTLIRTTKVANVSSRIFRDDTGTNKFSYKYSDGVSANARIDINFNDLFK